MMKIYTRGLSNISNCKMLIAEVSQSFSNSLQHAATNEPATLPSNIPDIRNSAKCYAGVLCEFYLLHIPLAYSTGSTLQNT